MRVIASVIAGLTFSAAVTRADGDISQVLAGQPAPAATVIPGTETGDLPPLLMVPGEPAVRASTRKSCRTCASDYNPNLAYLPDENPDCRGGRCGGAKSPAAETVRVSADAFIGLGSNIRDVDHQVIGGFKLGAATWLDAGHTVGLDAGYFGAHDPFRNTFLTVNGPKLVDSPVTLSTADANLRLELYTGGRVRVDGLVGYRYLSLHEQILEGSAAGVNFWETYNSVHLGQVGAAGSYRFGPYTLEALLKLGFGRNSETAEVNGVRTRTSDFAFVPEFAARAGYGSDGFRMVIGYQLLYLSQAVRPDNRQPSDYFLHGLTVGAEVRY